MTTNANLFARFAAHWDPDTQLLTTPSGEGFTYRDALAKSGQVAQFLQDLGIRSGDRVSVQAQKSVDYLWLFLGCLRGGFAFHPLNPAYTKSELAYFFTDAEPALVIYDPVSALQVHIRPARPARLGATGGAAGSDWLQPRLRDSDQGGRVLNLGAVR